MTESYLDISAAEGAGPAARRRPRPRRSGDDFGRRAAAWWWAVPGMLLLFLVHYVAVGAGAVFAFTDWRGIGSFEFVGFENFIRAANSPFVLTALGNTLFLAAFYLVLTNVIGVLLAIALNRTLKSRNVLRTLLFIPVVLSPLAVSYVWRFIFEYNGPLNLFVKAVWGPESAQLWLSDPAWAIWAILIVMVWQNVGLTMVIYLAGLASVPAELEEAAAVDGASAWTRFFRIVLPELRPAIIVASTLMLIQGLRVFDEVIGLTGGGPYGATETLSTQIWRQSFVARDFGFGSAIALILTVLIIVFSLLQNFLLRGRRERG